MMQSSLPPAKVTTTNERENSPDTGEFCFIYALYTEYLSIKEIREQTGLTRRALRYYEQLDLLHPAARADAGGYRLYSKNIKT